MLPHGAPMHTTCTHPLPPCQMKVTSTMQDARMLGLNDICMTCGQAREAFTCEVYNSALVIGCCTHMAGLGGRHDYSNHCCGHR